MEKIKSMREVDSEIISDLQKNIRTYDPDKKIEKEFGGEVTLDELESWSSDEYNFHQLGETLLEIYYYEKDNDNSERIFKAIKMLYKIRKEFITNVKNHVHSNNDEVLQIIDSLLNL